MSEDGHHLQEARRMEKELEELDDNLFPDDGVVKTVLRSRVTQEYERDREEQKERRDKRQRNKHG